MITLYHVTPYRNMKSIKSEGLIPKKGKRGVFGGDPDEKRIYFFTDRDVIEDAMVNWLLDEYNDRYFAIIQVHVPESVKFYKDPETPGAVYTMKRISPQNISNVEKIDVGEPE